jgi:hypothetical protein
MCVYYYHSLFCDFPYEYEYLKELHTDMYGQNFGVYKKKKKKKKGERKKKRKKAIHLLCIQLHNLAATVTAGHKACSASFASSDVAILQLDPLPKPYLIHHSSST